MTNIEFIRCGGDRQLCLLSEYLKRNFTIGNKKFESVKRFDIIQLQKLSTEKYEGQFHTIEDEYAYY